MRGFRQSRTVFNQPVDLRSLEAGQGVQESLIPHLLYQSRRAVTNLRKAPVTFTERVDPRAVGVSSERLLEIDYGDVLAMQAALESIYAAASLLASYNAEANLVDLAYEADEGTLDIQADLLNTYPDLLRVQDLTHLAEAKSAGRAALGAALESALYVRFADDADQRDDLIPLDGDMARQEMRWRPQVEQLYATFSTTIDPDPHRVGDEFRVRLNPLFDVPLNPREFLPQFRGLTPRLDTLPDRTFGGMLPDTMNRRGDAQPSD